jgi:exoribonuclease-2
MSWTAAELREPSQQAAILRRLKPTSISVTKGPHFTLGTDGYTQVTSPLRRYQDLVVHQQIRAHLLNEEFPYDEAALLAIVERGERRLGDLRRVEIETRRYWTLEYLRAHPAKRYVAHVLRRINRGWLVQLDEVMQQAILRTKRKVKPGVQLMVAVVQVDARRNRLVVHEPE